MSESCVFMNEDKSVWIIVYMDDIAIAVQSKAQIDRVVCQLGSKFMLTEIGEVKPFLGLKLVHDRKLRIIQVRSAQWVSNNTRPDVAYTANFLDRQDSI